MEANTIEPDRIAPLVKEQSDLGPCWWSLGDNQTIVQSHWNLANYMFTCKISFKKNIGMPGYIIIEPVHEISNNVVCATSKASDQPAHTRSLIRAFACRLSILLLLSY